MRSYRLLLGLAGLPAVAIVLADVATAFAQKHGGTLKVWLDK